MRTVRQDLLDARRVAARAVTLAMLGVSAEAAAASLNEAAGFSRATLTRARVLLEISATGHGSLRREAETLLAAAACHGQQAWAA